MEYKDSHVVEMTNHNNVFILDIFTSDYCNYNCWYCWPGAHAATTKLPALSDLAKNNLRHIVKSLQGNKQLIVKFSGGEPTIWQHIEDYVEFFKKEFDAKIEIITNGSRTIRWWKKNLNVVDYVAVSVHPLQADINHLVELGKLFVENNKMYCMRVSVVPGNIDLVNSFAKKLTDNGIYTTQKYLNLTYLENPPEEGSIVKNWNPKMYKNEEIDQKAFWNRTSKAKPLYEIDSTIQTERSKEKWKKLSLTYFSGHWRGYNCFAPGEYIFLNAQGKIQLACKNKIQNDFNSLKIFKNDYTKEKFVKTVMCDTGFCKCEGLWQVGKQYVDS